LPKYPIFHNDKILPVAQLLLALWAYFDDFLTFVPSLMSPTTISSKKRPSRCF